MFWNELLIAPVRDESGKVTHFIGIQNDVTERKTHESQLERQANYDDADRAGQPQPAPGPPQPGADLLAPQ